MPIQCDKIFVTADWAYIYHYWQQPRCHKLAAPSLQFFDQRYPDGSMSNLKWFRKQAHIQGEKIVSQALRPFSMLTIVYNFLGPIVLDLEHSERWNRVAALRLSRWGEDFLNSRPLYYFNLDLTPDELGLEYYINPSMELVSSSF
jgi:hypothetical protein